MNSGLDDARLVVAQLLYVLTHLPEDGSDLDVPLALRDLGPVELTPEGVQARLETMVAGACQALLAVLDVAAVHGLTVEDGLQQAALRLASTDPGA